MRLFLAIAFDWRALLVLAAGILGAALLASPVPVLIGLALYFWAIRSLARSPAYQKAAEKVRIAQKLAQQYRIMEELAKEVEKLLPREPWFIRVVSGLLTSPEARQERSLFARATDVITGARAIYGQWREKPEEYADKVSLVEEMLKMAQLYLRVLRSYHAIYMNRHKLSLQEVRNRLIRNMKRLEGMTDLSARRELEHSIELDCKVLDQAGEGEAEKERLLVKLTALEATMDLLRRQIFNPGIIETPLHEMLLEAEAMGEALQEVQQRTRVRVR